MILSFANKLAEDFFEDRQSKEVRNFPFELHRSARRKILYLHDAAELSDLKLPPGNKLEALKGTLTGYYSIRINIQWRIVFRWNNGNAEDVSVVDYH
ncbi:MAG: type II toxin-antitoxin system RelE/ParE family toxin [Bacteriovorax sp.]|jgi:proteic killer suppression protein|nr:type II toxin-antitoxin system RelE/ParE family toxin [Bacteriovorax sp.]